MVNQMVSPVMWHKTIETLLDSQVDIFVEIGPGKTLSNFTKKIAGKKQVEVYQVDDMLSLSNLVDKIYN